LNLRGRVFFAGGWLPNKALPPTRVSAQHQSLLHFVGTGGWSDKKVMAKTREMVVPEMERHGCPRDRRVAGDRQN
jgi:SRSO17 transposase